MTRSSIRRVAQAAGFAVVFACGYVLGTLDAQPAQAQVKDYGKELMNKTTGTALGTASQLGTTITDMQSNVTKLQKNIDALNKIKAALGG